MEKHLKKFDSNRKERGCEIYENKKIKYVVKYNNSFYSKVLGINENYYLISIDNNNLNCNCQDDILCKHIYASLLSIIHNKYTVINLNELSKENLLELIQFCIKKDLNIFENIEKIINKQNKKFSLKEIENFFENFENNDCKYLMNEYEFEYEYENDYDYEYDEDIFNDYDDELIDILKNIQYDNIYNIKENINKFVSEKIEYFNDNLDDYDFIVFPKTMLYLVNSNN